MLVRGLVRRGEVRRAITAPSSWSGRWWARTRASWRRPWLAGRVPSPVIARRRVSTRSSRPLRAQYTSPWRAGTREAMTASWSTGPTRSAGTRSATVKASRSPPDPHDHRPGRRVQGLLVWPTGRRERTEARKAEVRARIVAAARELIAHGGYARPRSSRSPRGPASRPGPSTGTSRSKADLFAEVFRGASQREVDAVVDAAAVDDRSAAARIAAAVETFARRALRGRRLAWALIAEPVDPAVEAERLVFRRAYRDAFADVIAAGVDERRAAARRTRATSAAALVGAIGEALVGPVSPTDRRPRPGVAGRLAARLLYPRGNRKGTRAMATRRAAPAPPPPTRSSTRRRRSRTTTPSPPTGSLVEALRREGGDWAEDRVARGRRVRRLGAGDRAGASRRTRTRRGCKTHDRFGNRIDEVEFHPAWHELLAPAVGSALHALPWREPQPGAHVARGGDVHRLRRPRPASAARSR